ncbi:hypothetical protein [Marinicella meishanensis]|uniref:hypothetical protein n=1 Tax=Marinicella meishanensis TaxID=2873263 RepID=UPI001CBDB384|nr:hypothetical protein [Marinicella sp. NBU2979]
MAIVLLVAVLLVVTWLMVLSLIPIILLIACSLWNGLVHLWWQIRYPWLDGAQFSHCLKSGADVTDLKAFGATKATSFGAYTCVYAPFIFVAVVDSKVHRISQMAYDMGKKRIRNPPRSSQSMG